MRSDGEAAVGPCQPRNFQCRRPRSGHGWENLANSLFFNASPIFEAILSHAHYADLVALPGWHLPNTASLASLCSKGSILRTGGQPSQSQWWPAWARASTLTRRVLFSIGRDDVQHVRITLGEVGGGAPEWLSYGIWWNTKIPMKWWDIENKLNNDICCNVIHLDLQNYNWRLFILYFYSFWRRFFLNKLYVLLEPVSMVHFLGTNNWEKLAFSKKKKKQTHKPMICLYNKSFKNNLSAHLSLTKRHMQFRDRDKQIRTIAFCVYWK